jgi:hypothetical protein
LGLAIGLSLGSEFTVPRIITTENTEVTEKGFLPRRHEEHEEGRGVNTPATGCKPAKAGWIDY